MSALLVPGAIQRRVRSIYRHSFRDRPVHFGWNNYI